MRLYHDKEPAGRIFDQDSAKEAMRKGWKKENPNVTIEEGKKPESDQNEHQGNDVGGLSAKAGSGSIPQPSRERKGWPKGKKRKV